MFRMLFALTAAAVLFATPCMAQSTHTAIFTVPMAFQFDSTQFPAGEYQLILRDQVATLRNMDKPQFSAGWSAPMVRRTEELRNQGHLHLVLSGGQYYLHQVEADTHQAHIRIPKSIDILVAKASSSVKHLTIVGD